MNTQRRLELTRQIVSRVTMKCLGVNFSFRVEVDKKRPKNGRIFIQAVYLAPCTKTGHDKMWSGRKWYLSDHMTPDEVIKTAYTAFESAVKHEVMEGFKVDGKILFNPHINFEALLEISNQEISRDDA